LDEFDQPILKNHLAGRDRKVLPDDELLGPDRRPAACRPLPVLDQVLKSLDEVVSAFGDRLRRHFRIGPKKIRGREDIENLTGRERQPAFVALRNAVHPRGGMV
jgi:hypothetical protein